MRIAFIGGGVMAQAIIAGVKDAGLDASIIVGEPSRFDASPSKTIWESRLLPTIKKR